MSDDSPATVLGFQANGVIRVEVPELARTQATALILGALGQANVYVDADGRAALSFADGDVQQLWESVQACGVRIRLVFQNLIIQPRRAVETTCANFITMADETLLKIPRVTSSFAEADRRRLKEMMRFIGVPDSDLLNTVKALAYVGSLPGNYTEILWEEGKGLKLRALQALLRENAQFVSDYADVDGVGPDRVRCLRQFVYMCL